MMTFGGVPIFEWIGLLLALGLGVEWWLTRRALDREDSSDAPAARTDPDEEQGPVNRG
jgi:hypothetical protein